MSFIYLLELKDPKKISILLNLMCGALGVAGAVAFTMALQMFVIYIFLAKED